MIQKAKGGEKLPVYGDGKNIRDWINVKDHCEAIDVVLHKGKDGEVYNIGGEDEKYNKSSALFELSGDSVESLKWKKLDQKLQYPRVNHVSFLIPDTCNPY